MAAQGWTSSSSSSSFEAVYSFSYDVFISFRGKDTRKNFTGFLYKTLKNKGIDAFLDSQKLWTGEAIAPALQKAIVGSKISIPVISKGYADSKWCLEELALIVQCYRSKNQIILPIFFYVKPSDVRNQTGSFEDAFLKYQETAEPEKVESWREALRLVGDLKGEVLDDTKDQAELVELVAKRALSELVSSTRLAECEYRIDMDSRVNDLLSLLDVASRDVQFVGICGFGGLGKTTLAKAVYNHIFSTFDKLCFLSDVRERAAQFNGLVSLQKQLLKDIFKEDFDIEDSHKGKRLIEERVSKEKVFVVLDDVDGKEQIGALAGKLNWFGQGSRVIITTKDEQILNLAKVNSDKIYKPKLLSHAHSLQLFSWHAFQNRQPPKEYMQLSHDVVDHSEGLPLILEVFGSYLSDVGNKDEWESTLKMLKEISPEEVQRKLRISYDNLENDYQRDIFLDAACFFIGWEKEIVNSIWEACGYHPKSAVSRLIKRSLLKFDGEYLVMHDHIRDMGREIVLEESRLDPSKRSRLWSYSDIVEVLEGHKGTQTIQGLSLSYALRLPINLTVESLEMMPNLRFLNGMNFKILCPNLYHRRLVSLTLSDIDSNQLWNARPPDEHERFQNLKFLMLLRCHSLSKSPEFSWFPSLEQLDIIECSSLDELDESIGQLSQLKSLIVTWCSSLNNLPNSIGDLRSLIKLDLLKTSIEEFPDSICRMSSLKELFLNSCVLRKKLPESIGDLQSLVKLALSSTRIKALPDSISRMGYLKELFLESCVLLKKLPESIGDLKSLIMLNLSYSGIYELPKNISKMSPLKVLILKGCKSLNKLPESIGDLKSLVMLDLSYSGIEELPDDISKMSLKEFIFEGCLSLKKLPESIGNILKCQLELDLSRTCIKEVPNSICRMSSLKEINFSRCYLLKKLPDSIGDLRSLIKLDLSNTNIEELPDSISRMGSLKKLILVSCESLKKLPQSIGDLKSLVKLDLSSSGIYELPENISKMSSLKKLILKRCESLKKLHESIGDLKSLVKLNLSYSGIEELPSNISKMSLKEFIFVGCLSLKKLPESIDNILKCQLELDLSGTCIEGVPNSICRMSSLKEINFSHCRLLKKLPDSIGDLSSLDKLDLSKTSIEELPDSISRMDSLKELILACCESLKKLPQSIGDLTSLVKLDLSYSGIDELPDNISRTSPLKELVLKGCKSLRKLPESIDSILKCQLSLDLSETGIEKVTNSIGKMSSLKEISFSHCDSLKKLPESIGDLKSLVKLDLSNSGIEELPDSISGMSSLKMLILRECWSLMKFPNVLGRLHELNILDFGGCTNLVKLPRPKGGRRYLDRINLNLINITKFPDDFSMPQNLVKLKIKHLGLQSFPLDIAPLKTLKQLKICGCRKLEYLPELPSNLVEICCEDCDSLGRLSDLSKLKSLTTLKLRYCRKLEEIPDLEGTESLEELNVEGCFNLRHAPRKTQATLLPDNRALALGSAHALTANDGIYKNGFILSFGLEFFHADTKLWEGHQLVIHVQFSAIVYQKEKRIRCLHTLRIEDVKEPYDQETICSYHFKGFNWFGIPLQGKDSIQILDVRIHSFKWSYVDEVGAVVMLNYAPNQHQSIILLNCIRLDPISEVVGQEEDTLNLTCWPRAEVEGLSIVPDKQKEEEEVEEDRNNVPTVDLLSRLGLGFVSDAMEEEEEEENNVPIIDFLSRLGLGSVSDTMEEEEENNVPAVDFLSCLGLGFVSDAMEEEEENNVPTIDFLSHLGWGSVSDAMEEEKENNVLTVEFLSRLGLDSVSDVMAEGEDNLRHSYRVGLCSDNDDGDEAPDAGSCFCFHPFLFLRSLLFRS